MTTIFDAAASAERLNMSLAGAFQPRSTIAGQAAMNLVQIHQPQFARLSATVVPSLKSAVLAQAIAKSYQPLLDAVLALEGLDLGSLDISSASSTGGGLPQRLGDREIAAMLTVAAFLMMYISFGLLIKRSPQVAKLAATDGPTPFEAAMAVGALVFWLWMNHSHGRKSE